MYDRKKKQQPKKGGAEEEQQVEPAEAEAAPMQVGSAGQGAACGRAGRCDLGYPELQFSRFWLKGRGCEVVYIA